MVLGNPDKFAVLTEIIKEWNIDDTFWNGLLLFWVNGVLYPKETITESLRREVLILKEHLAKLAADKYLYRLPALQAFIEIYNITFPEDDRLDNDYRFIISPDLMSDNGYFIFAVRNGAGIRILASRLNYETCNSRYNLQDITINETFITDSELDIIIKGLELFCIR